MTIVESFKIGTNSSKIENDLIQNSLFLKIMQKLLQSRSSRVKRKAQGLIDDIIKKIA